MATPNQPQLSDSQLAELEKLARAQERSADEVASEAVGRYIRDKQWEAVKRYGVAKSRERGLTEGDVVRLIAESRGSAGDKRCASLPIPISTSRP
jgi:predicted transcriptional regulator